MGWMECGGGLAPLDRTLIGAAVLTCLMSTAPTTRAVAASEQQQLAALPDERSGSDLVPGPRLVQSTQRQAKQLFKLEPQPLAQALRKFSEQTGIQVAYNRAELAGRTTDGLSGVFLPEEVLKKLLAGSGARYRYTYDDAVLVRVAQAAGGTAADVDLATITVQGDGETGGGSSAETAWGPVDGYVAKKSATATKTGTAPIETPQSISIITRDQMDARAVQNIGEAVQYTAGVRSNLQGESSGLGGSSISIRGFGGDGTAGASENEYIDGLRIRGTDFASAGFEPYLFERVEVLK
ncbi:MAG: TonB-dependent receptor plug domain-containing protein, partial [Hyphomicrobiales bacterium]|nr:TonB-dependent receptor plug domain-containing protein [Hyphomicrobiales bacterium]